MSSATAIDDLDPVGYLHSTLNADVVLKELGFRFEGTSTLGKDHWLKPAGRGIWHSVIVDKDAPTVNYRKVKVSGRGVLDKEFQVLTHKDVPVSEVRRYLMKWHTEAQEVIHTLLDDDPDALDPRADLERLIPHRCPECGSSNISSEADDEGLLDCFNCGIWFDPLHPNNTPVINQDRGEVRMEAFDPDDPQAFLQSLPQHPEAAGMKQPKGSTNYWQYLFESREGYRCRLALYHSLPERTGSYTASLDVGGYYHRLTQETVTLFWRSQQEFTQVEMQLREAVQRFIQAIKDCKERKNRPSYAELERLWNKLFEPLNQGPRPASESLDPDDPVQFIARLPDRSPRIRTSFSQTTPESSEQGDLSATGWIDQEGEEMVPDDIDYEEGLGIVDLAVKFLHNKGAIEPSSSRFHLGVWYSTDWSTVDYRTGTDEQHSFHLVDFTPGEEKEIWDKLHAQWRREREM